MELINVGLIFEREDESFALRHIELPDAFHGQLWHEPFPPVSSRITLGFFVWSRSALA
jgi:hypothetical protein